MFRYLSFRGKTLVVLWISTLLLLCSHPVLADFDTDPFYDQRVKLDAPPAESINEHIDPFSGNMLIVQTDLHLPGNGGLDLTIMRTYNSLIYSRRDDTLNSNYFVAKKDKSPLGIGWSMHMGLLRYPQAPGTQWGGSPILELPDGTKQIFFQDKSDTSRLISKEFWVLKNKQYCDYNGHGDWEVKSPEGVVYSFNNCNAAGYKTTDLKEVAQVVKIQNPAGTAAINITYYKTGDYSYLKTITDSVGRVVTFTYDYTKRNLLSISTDSRTITYTYQRIGSTDPIDLLKTVTPPVGNSWSYNYDATYELSELTFPTGGKNSYTYTDTSFKTGESCSLPYRVVTQKQTSGRNITGGIWTYAYNSGGSNITRVTAPNSVTEVHKFYGWGSGNISTGNVWKVGLPISREFNFNGATMSESFGWTAGSSVSTTSISNINWGCPGFLVSDSGVFPAQLSSKTVTRDGKTYTASYSSFDGYGNPKTITESGDKNRTSSMTYCTSSSKNVVKGRYASESVSGGFSGTGTTSWTYDSDCINPTTISRDGVTKQYTYNSNGNLASFTDANSHTTTYEWSNGRISKATNPLYAVSRVINTDGTIQSETNGRGYKTSYSYDKNLRLTGSTPPVGNATSISYPADSSSRTETRGSYTLTRYFDGFARPTGSLDSKGVTTSIAYNAYGTKTTTDSNVGDKTTYDFFGRPTQVLDKDAYSESYSYGVVSGITSTTVTDKNSKTSVFTYTAFANPDEKYLMAVKDQAGTTTSYTRNIRNRITGITQGGISHSYNYNTKYFLTSEVHPESGTSSYGRDSAGNMTSRTDATGTKSYAYDALDRLTSMTAGGKTNSFGYDNADNRTSATSPSASFTYAYDAANRLTAKNETIAGYGYAIAYSYDSNDNITKITYPSGRAVTYGYNGNNQVTSVDGFGGSVTSVTYNTAGLPTAYTYSNGITNTISYNNRNLTTGLTSGSAVKLTYGYDSRGNTTAITNGLTASASQTFGYDNINRVTSFQGAWGSGSYTYDGYGNRTAKSVGGTATSYSYSSNRLGSASGGEAASYSYNNNGALTGGTWSGSQHTLGYDSFDNLTSFTTGSSTMAIFGYDGDGTRVTKTANGKTTVYHYGLGNLVLSESDSNKNLLADFVYLNGKLVAKISSVNSSQAYSAVAATVNKQINSTAASQNLLVITDNQASKSSEQTAAFTTDNTPPALTLSVLSEGSITQNKTFNLSGDAKDDSAIKELNINEVVVPVAQDGRFSHALQLKAGDNLIKTVLTDLAGNHATDTRTIKLDEVAPELTITTPADNSMVYQPELELTGTVNEAATIIVSLNGIDQPVSINNAGYIASLNLNPDINTIQVTTIMQDGRSNALKRTVIYDNQRPSLAITVPAQDIHTNKSEQTISGTVSDPYASVQVSISLDGALYSPVVVNGRFEQRVMLTSEKNHAIVVTATNEAGITASVQRNIIYEIAPTQPAEQSGTTE